MVFLSKRVALLRRRGHLLTVTPCEHWLHIANRPEGHGSWLGSYRTAALAGVLAHDAEQAGARQKQHICN
jgi:hypothetical protein